MLLNFNKSGFKMIIIQIMSLIIFAYIFFISSIPLIFKKIKPDFFYGLKTKKTLENEETWYKANKVFGITLYITAVIMLSGSIFLYYFHNLINRIFFQLIFFIVFFVPLFLSTIISYIYLYNLKPSSTNKK